MVVIFVKGIPVLDICILQGQGLTIPGNVVIVRGCALGGNLSIFIRLGVDGGILIPVESHAADVDIGFDFGFGLRFRHLGQFVRDSSGNQLVAVGIGMEVQVKRKRRRVAGVLILCYSILKRIVYIHHRAVAANRQPDGGVQRTHPLIKGVGDGLRLGNYTPIGLRQVAVGVILGGHQQDDIGIGLLDGPHNGGQVYSKSAQRSFCPL